MTPIDANNHAPITQQEAQGGPNKGQGHIPAGRLEKLQMRFSPEGGDNRLDGIISDDGKLLDRAALQQLIREEGGLKIGHLKNGKEADEVEESDTKGDSDDSSAVADETSGDATAISPQTEETVQNIADKISSGELSKEDFVAKLRERFGDDANGILDDDGAINYQALLELIEANSLNVAA